MTTFDTADSAIPVTLPAASVPTEIRSSRARVPLIPAKGLLGRVLTFYSKRKYGQVLDNLLAMSHNRKVLLADGVFELSLARWNKLDEQLKQLAVMAASVDIGCSWCMDFGYFEAHSAGLDMAKIQAVPGWRSASVFTPTERRVLEYTEAMTATPPTVTDEMAQALRHDLGDDGLVELSMMVCVENLRSRFNAALGLQSQGFSESCRVDGHRPDRSGSSDQ